MKLLSSVCVYVEIEIVTASTKGFTWFWSLIIFSPMHNFISFHFDFRIYVASFKNIVQGILAESRFKNKFSTFSIFFAEY